MMKCVFLALALVFVASVPAAAQVVVFPPITAGHCASWKSLNILQDAGAACGSGSGSVTSISNSDGTMTLSPNPITTTGTVSLNLAHSNTWTAVQAINLNATALPTAQTGTILQLAQTGTTAPRLELDPYGTSGFFTAVRRSGTAAAPTQVLAGEQIGGFNAMALDDAATIRGPFVSFRSYAAENITSTNQGGIGCIAATPLTTTTLGDQLCIYGNTGVIIGGASATTVPGGKLTITQGTANASVLTSSGYSLTGSSTTPMISLAGTLNTSGAPVVIGIDLTETADNASTILFRLRGGSAGTSPYLTVPSGGGVNIGVSNGGNVKLASAGSSTLTIGTNSGSVITPVTAPVSNSLQAGFTDTASPTAQIWRHQSVVAGTSNISGVNWTMIGSLSTGSGTSGDVIFQTGSTGAGATVQNTATNALIIKGATQQVRIPQIASDAGLTDSSVCQDTTNHGLFAGSGTLGICLGTSSARFKRDIHPMTAVAIDKIAALTPTSYRYNNPNIGNGGKRRDYWLIAEATAKVLPECVPLDRAGRPQTVDPICVQAFMLKAMKEQQAQIALLNTRLSKLAAK